MRRVRTLSALVALTLLYHARAGQNTASTRGPMDGAESHASLERGRRLYRTGTSARGTAPEACIAGTEPVPAALFPCAQCHGLDGSGGVEGGAAIPDLRPARLAFLRGASTRSGARPAYDDALLARAITGGLDSGGATLSPSMPRYALAGPDLVDLLAYLAVLDQERAPGVSDGELRVGTLLSLSGPDAERGRATRRALDAAFARCNANGGIHGRRLVLCARDAAGSSAGDSSAAALAAAQSLLESESGVLCCVAPAQAGADGAVLEFLARRGVPVIAPLCMAPDELLPGSVFWLLPSLADQGRALARGLAETSASGAPFACLEDGSPCARALAAGVTGEAERLGLCALRDPAALARERPARLVCLGSAPWVNERLAELRALGWWPRVLVSTALLEGELRGEGFELELLAPPLGSTTGDAAERGAPTEAAREARVSSEARLARAAALLLCHALETAGRRVDGPALLDALEGVRHFETDVLPPLAFGRARRVGTRASTLATFDAHGYGTALRWIEPAPLAARDTLPERRR